MPYIKKVSRDKYDDLIDEITLIATESGRVMDGDINYIITKILLDTIATYDGKSYYSIERAVGCLECVKLELYRRLAAPYEDMKKDEEGDVYL